METNGALFAEFLNSNNNESEVMTYQTCGNYSGPDLPYFPVESRSETIDKSANKVDSSSEIEIQNEIENKNKNENENENENETETGNGKSIHSLRTSDEVDSCEVLHEKEQNEGEEQGEEQGEEGGCYQYCRQ